MRTLSENWAAYFQRGTWRAEVIDRNAPPMNHNVAQSIRYTVKIYTEGHRADWPVRYEDGRIVYAIVNPPMDARRAARAAYDWILTGNEMRTGYEDSQKGGDYDD